jgi:hypothetical protein
VPGLTCFHSARQRDTCDTCGDGSQCSPDERGTDFSAASVVVVGIVGVRDVAVPATIPLLVRSTASTFLYLCVVNATARHCEYEAEDSDHESYGTAYKARDSAWSRP